MRPSNSAVTNATVIVTSVTDSDSRPVFATWVRLSPKPSATIDHCSTCLPPKRMPGANAGPGASRLRTRMPSTMPNTGPPMSGSLRPSHHATSARPTDSSRPGHMPSGMARSESDSEEAFMVHGRDAKAGIVDLSVNQ